MKHKKVPGLFLCFNSCLIRDSSLDVSAKGHRRALVSKLRDDLSLLSLSALSLRSLSLGYFLSALEINLSVLWFLRSYSYY